MRFKDRDEAGHILAEKLVPLVRPPCVVAAIPRGGVAVALPVVERLRAPLTVAYARKLTAPVAPELAFGAIDEDGQVIIDRDTVEMLGLGREEVEQAKARVGAEIRRRMARYGVPPLAHYLPEHAVVLVDDGLATGLTMRAAVVYARRRGAREITVAAPCAAAEAASRFQREADRVVSLVVDEAFMAVGQYYVDFSPVTDEAVTAMLAWARKLTAGQQAGGDAMTLSFRNRRGLRLTADLLLPAPVGRHPVVVFAHGFGSGRNSPRNRAVAHALQAEGIASLLFDFTGHGDSEGTEDESTQTRQVEDLRSAVGLVTGMEEIDATRIGVLGASSGAAVALRLAAESPRIQAVVLRSGNLEGAEQAVSRITVPTLLMVGQHDEPTRTANEEAARRFPGPHQLEVVPRGDHLFADAGALRVAVDLSVRWFKAHLAAEQVPAA